MTQSVRAQLFYYSQLSLDVVFSFICFFEYISFIGVDLYRFDAIGLLQSLVYYISSYSTRLSTPIELYWQDNPRKNKNTDTH